MFSMCKESIENGENWQRINRKPLKSYIRERKGTQFSSKGLIMILILLVSAKSFKLFNK